MTAPGLLAPVAQAQVAGTAACLVWHKIITDFRSVIHWQYEKLRAIEKELPDTHRVCTEEYEALYKPVGGRERFGLSRREVWLPRLFMALGRRRRRVEVRARS